MSEHITTHPAGRTDHITAHPDGRAAVNPTTRFERKDANLPALVAIGGGLAVVVVAVCLVCWWLFAFLQTRDRERNRSMFPLAAEERGKPPAEPQLEQVERMEAAKAGERLPPLYEAERRRLESFGWVDEKKQIAHIPIDRAMKMIVEQQRLRARPDSPKADK